MKPYDQIPLSLSLDIYIYTYTGYAWLYCFTYRKRTHRPVQCSVDFLQVDVYDSYHTLGAAMGCLRACEQARLNIHHVASFIFGLVSLICVAI